MAPPVSYSTDLRQLLDETGEIIDGKTSELATYFGRIAECASRLRAREEREIAMPCAIPRRRADCQGVLMARRDSRDCASWYCPICDVSGRVSGWAGGAFDLEGVRPMRTIRYTILARPEELLVARGFRDLGPSLRACLADAHQGERGLAHVELTLDELELLYFRASEVAEQARGERRRNYDRFEARLESVLIAVLDARDRNVTTH